MILRARASGRGPPRGSSGKCPPGAPKRRFYFWDALKPIPVIILWIIIMIIIIIMMMIIIIIIMIIITMMIITVIVAIIIHMGLDPTLALHLL